MKALGERVSRNGFLIGGAVGDIRPSASTTNGEHVGTKDTCYIA